MVTLSGADGRAVLGSDAGITGRPAVRLATVTRLPWTLEVFGKVSDADIAAAKSRQQLFALAMLLVVALILLGAALMSRAVTRELAVARQQSEFVSTVSHEFRTPLASLCQLSELLDDGRVATDADRQTYYRFLRHESERLRRLVEGLLQFGRVEAGTLQLRFETVGAASFLQSCTDEFVGSGQIGRHRLDVEVAGDAPIQTDRDALTCVLWNLLENAVKYSPGADVIRVRLSAHPRRVEIAVSDDGPGIPKAEQARIFEKFTRGSAAVAGQIRGAGIGLSTAREIAKALGGDIVIDSEPGRGSTFTVLLPVATLAETGRPASLVHSSRGM
jgi:signal transduction histidine kinase